MPTRDWFIKQLVHAGWDERRVVFLPGHTGAVPAASLVFEGSDDGSCLAHHAGEHSWARLFQTEEDALQWVLGRIQRERNR